MSSKPVVASARTLMLLASRALPELPGFLGSGVASWLVVLAALLGCAAQTEAPMGGESNWLTSCKTSDECDGRCLCGVCSATCSGDDGCAPGTCVSLDHPALQNSCVSLPKGAGMCRLECAEDADCPGTQTCASGVCGSFGSPRLAERAGSDGGMPVDAGVPTSTPIIFDAAAPATAPVGDAPTPESDAAEPAVPADNPEPVSSPVASSSGEGGQGSGGVLVECTPGSSRSCAEAGVLGACSAGVQVCTQQTESVSNITVYSWGPCSISPATADACDVLGDDSNCNGIGNEGCTCLESDPMCPSDMTVMPLPPCAESVEWTQGTVPTVVTVSWETSRAVQSAFIEYGLAGDPERFFVPVDVTADKFETTLLGLKAGREYEFQIGVGIAVPSPVGGGAAEACSSDRFPLRTGDLPAGLPVAELATLQAGGHTGFVIVPRRPAEEGDPDTELDTVILDRDGDLVWHAPTPRFTTRARMDWEGQNLWSMGVDPAQNTVTLRRTSMDGAEVEDVDLTPALAAPFGPTPVFDFTVVPGGSVVALVPGETCAAVIERRPDGEIVPIVGDVGISGVKGGCTPTSISYDPVTDRLVVGDVYSEIYYAFTRTGEFAWQFGGERDGQPHFPLPDRLGAVRGHHLTDVGTLLLFEAPDGTNAVVSEYALDFGTSSAVLAWELSRPSQDNGFGEVQRLPNGNTLVSDPGAGVIAELDLDRALVSELSIPGELGYVLYRESLYGPPSSK